MHIRKESNMHTYYRICNVHVKHTRALSHTMNGNIANVQR